MRNLNFTPCRKPLFQCSCTEPALMSALDIHLQWGNQGCVTIAPANLKSLAGVVVLDIKHQCRLHSTIQKKKKAVRSLQLEIRIHTVYPYTLATSTISEECHGFHFNISSAQKMKRLLCAAALANVMIGNLWVHCWLLQSVSIVYKTNFNTEEWFLYWSKCENC